MKIDVLNRDQAPDDSRPLLEQAERSFGFVPNILGTMAHAPALLEGYMTLSGIFDKTSFSTTEKQVVLLAASAENGCSYCTAAHSAGARRQGVDDAIVDAIEQAAETGESLPDDRLDRLYRFTRTLVETRGRPSDDDLDAFLSAGFEPAQVQEVILGIGLKTLSNYNNHVAEPPVDDAFKGVASSR
ncbi:carboxymuconolactone decarboxylase family protein [Halomonas denitrificans]|nr:carboxymuconolactone decarboxylase family protein [Halomonas denitrificans]